MKSIQIDYDGEYPNLCSGQLNITILGKVWEFPEYCMASGGSVSFTGDWEEEIEDGPWSIDNWPEGFPEELKRDVLESVNSKIPWGCCGGCV